MISLRASKATFYFFFPCLEHRALCRGRDLSLSLLAESREVAPERENHHPGKRNYEPTRCLGSPHRESSRETFPIPVQRGQDLTGSTGDMNSVALHYPKEHSPRHVRPLPPLTTTMRNSSCVSGESCLVWGKNMEFLSVEVFLTPEQSQPCRGGDAQACWRWKVQGKNYKSQSSAAETLSLSVLPSSDSSLCSPQCQQEDTCHLLSQQVPGPAHAIQHKLMWPSAQTQIWQPPACLLRLPVSSEHSQRGITAFLRVLPFFRN